MGDGEALLRAVLAKPRDDAPRLVYADWLDEHGQAAAADYIRACCAIRTAPDVARLSAQLATFRGLLFEPGGVLGGRVFHAAGLLAAEPRAGFLSDIELPCRALMAHAGLIFSALPVEAVRVSDRWPRRDGPGGGWAWARGPAAGPADRWPPGLDEPWVLPDQLFAALAGAEGATDPAPFATEDRARVALRLACVRYGRRLVGLPPAL
jgi:uncharacterized protein (TIGR02996 family)